MAAVAAGRLLDRHGETSWEQRATAALLYGGPGAVITGLAALRNYGVRAPDPGVVDVLVPAGRDRQGRALVAIHCTRRMPQQWTVDGFLRFALPPRAVADTVRELIRVTDARAVVAGAVQQGHCTVGQLAAELRQGPIRGSAQLPAVLAEVIDGIRSVPEATSAA